MNSRFTLILLVLPVLTALSNPANAQTHTALELNESSTQAVNFSGEIVPINGPYTVEFWAYLPSTADFSPGVIHPFIYQGAWESASLWLGYEGTNGYITVGDWWNADINPVGGYTSVPVPKEQWFHLALSGNSADGTAELFLNGVRIDRPHGPATQLFLMGSGDNTALGHITDPFGDTYATAKLDEVRIWNVQKSKEDIRTNMFGPVATNSTGLVAYYRMDDASAGKVVNKSTSTETSPTPSDLDGTLQGAPLFVSSPIVTDNNAIALNGTNGKVHIDNNPDFSLFSGGTVEAWIYPTKLDAIKRTIIGNRDGTDIDYSFHVTNDGSGPHVGVQYDGGYGEVAAAIPLNDWTHLAFVYDESAGKFEVFVNGVSVGTITGAIGSIPSLPLSIGVSRNFVDPTTDGQAFEGYIDEVRIWTEKRLAADIFSTKDISITGTETGLVGLWTFDQGLRGGDNTGLKTVIDRNMNATANNYGYPQNGRLENVNLSGGTTSNFVGHGATTLPVTLTRFTVVKQGTSAVLQWQTAMEQNSKEFTIQHSTDGIKYTGIGTVQAAGNSNTVQDYTFTDPQPATGQNFYRLKQSDLDGKFTYSPIRTLDFSITGKLVWYSTGNGSAEVSFLSGSNEVYTISDLGGRQIRKGTLSNGRTSLSNLPGGMYVVQVTTFSGNVFQTKITLP